MYTATDEQLAAHREKTDEHEDRELEHTKLDLIRNFLRLAQQFASDGGNGYGGGSDGDTKLPYLTWELESSSAYIKLPDEEDSSVPMGARIKGYRHEIRRERRGLHGSDGKIIASKVMAAEVQVGPISEGTFPGLVKPEPVLVAYLNPPTVLLAENPESGLRTVKPGDEAWGQAESLVELMAKGLAALPSH